MSLVWPDYIHPDLPMTAEQRKAVLHDAWRMWWGNRWNLALHLAFSLIGFFALLHATDAGGWLASAVGISGSLHKACRAASLLIVMLAAAVFVRAVLSRCRFAPCVHRAMREHGYDVCPRCGYWLRGLGETGRCPECGSPHEPVPEDETP